MNYATYSPEDNKLRLYVGRVPREEFLALRADGWTCTPKQRENGGCDFVATWTPSRRDTALEYGNGVIEDEDQPMAERAADRAERFSGYRDKRTAEAIGHADRYDSGPAAHGYQSQTRAERAAARHDRIADRSCDSWSKAEYWQSRTAGVISHALYKSRPDVRMGRIKVLEAELRKHEKDRGEWCKTWRDFKKLSLMTDPEKQNELVRHYLGHYCHTSYNFKHPRPETVTNDHIKENGSSLYTLMGMVQSGYGSSDITGAEACAMWFAEYPNEPKQDDCWTEHYKLRLAYENQMLEAQGGRAAHVEMIAGGFIGSHQVQRVNKSPATGRVVSVMVKERTHGKDRWGNDDPKAPEFRLVQIDTERLPADAYRAPTDDELAAFNAEQKQAKARAKEARAKTAIPLINPTEADAERLQAIWNERAKARHCAAYLKEYGRDYADDFKPATVTKIKQETYSANSKGSYARAETRGLRRDAHLAPRESNMYNEAQAKRDKEQGPAVCNIRITYGGDGQFTPRSVIVLTDKPQKPLPAAVWKALKPATVAAEQEPKSYAGKSKGLSYTVNA